MRLKKRGLALAVAAATLGLVAACDKPAPYATVVSGGDSAGGEATAWCFEDGTFNASTPSSDCKAGPTNAGEIDVKPGGIVEVDVPPTVGEDGWTAALASSDGNLAPVSFVRKGTTYIRFTVPTDTSGDTTYVLELLALHPGHTAEKARGLWRFVLNVE
ncbi:hypothetical protein [Cryptosporangium aurantiacum]|uniref:DUF2771 domain-containing protein n=1 Tax=Cryptosporangium aurantiacum TaxID=134849 RepID=A0A1M7N0Q2_9ACTN|nr:hypothetical protein [Cryptosporangium aurantiacum]SHM97036.1 hypothetical protein SAMN05443668_102362 [Cryptosporangium aurantiacum]